MILIWTIQRPFYLQVVYVFQMEIGQKRKKYLSSKFRHNVKLAVPNFAPCHKDVGGVRGIALRTRNLRCRWEWVDNFMSWWLYSRADVDTAAAKKNTYAFPYQESTRGLVLRYKKVFRSSYCESREYLKLWMELTVPCVRDPIRRNINLGGWETFWLLCEVYTWPLPRVNQFDLPQNFISIVTSQTLRISIGT